MDVFKHLYVHLSLLIYENSHFKSICIKLISKKVIEESYERNWQGDNHQREGDCNENILQKMSHTV